jgi:O-antigen ligase
VTALAARWALLRHRRPSTEPWAIPAFAAALTAGWLFESRLMLIELAAVLLLALPLLVSPKTRVIFIVVGTVGIFGPSELNPSKMLFLFGATVALGGALWRGRELVRTPAYADLKPLFHSSFALLFVVALSLPVAHFNGVPDKEWLRDVAPYVLLSWAPVFALDAQSAFSIRALRRLIALVGLAGAAIFAKYWYQGHEISTAFSGDAGLATLLLSAALFSFAFAMALDGEKGRWRWLALGSLVFAMLATTGARTAAVLLVAPFAIAVGTRQGLARRWVRLAVVLPIAALLVAIGAQSLLRLVNANSERVTERVNLLFQAGGGSDASYVNRLNEIDAAWALFRSAPVFGVGPGHIIPWTDTQGDVREQATIDPPVGFLVDYGLVGLLAVGYLAASFVAVLRRLRRRAGERTTAQLALIGFGTVLVAYSFLQTPFEDKGLGTGLILLLAVASREATECSEQRIARGTPP